MARGQSGRFERYGRQYGMGRRSEDFSADEYSRQYGMGRTAGDRMQGRPQGYQLGEEQMTGRLSQPYSRSQFYGSETYMSPYGRETQAAPYNREGVMRDIQRREISMPLYDETRGGRSQGYGARGTGMGARNEGYMPEGYRPEGYMQRRSAGYMPEISEEYRTEEYGSDWAASPEMTEWGCDIIMSGAAPLQDIPSCGYMGYEGAARSGMYGQDMYAPEGRRSEMYAPETSRSDMYARQYEEQVEQYPGAWEVESYPEQGVGEMVSRGAEGYGEPYRREAFMPRMTEGYQRTEGYPSTRGMPMRTEPYGPGTEPYGTPEFVELPPQFGPYGRHRVGAQMGYGHAVYVPGDMDYRVEGYGHGTRPMRSETYGTRGRSEMYSETYAMPARPAMAARPMRMELQPMATEYRPTERELRGGRTEEYGTRARMSGAAPRQMTSAEIYGFPEYEAERPGAMMPERRMMPEGHRAEAYRSEGYPSEFSRWGEFIAPGAIPLYEDTRARLIAGEMEPSVRRGTGPEWSYESALRAPTGGMGRSEMEMRPEDYRSEMYAEGREHMGREMTDYGCESIAWGGPLEDIRECRMAGTEARGREVYGMMPAMPAYGREMRTAPYGRETYAQPFRSETYGPYGRETREPFAGVSEPFQSQTEEFGREMRREFGQSRRQYGGIGSEGVSTVEPTEGAIGQMYGPTEQATTGQTSCLMAHELGPYTPGSDYTRGREGDLRRYRRDQCGV